MMPEPGCQSASRRYRHWYPGVMTSPRAIPTLGRACWRKVRVGKAKNVGEESGCTWTDGDVVVFFRGDRVDALELKQQ